MLSKAPGLLIRDGCEPDIPACLALEHDYQTDYVWQMSFTQPSGALNIHFKTERLPRTLDAVYPADAQRLRLALAADRCFVVAVSKEDAEMRGYLTMLTDPARRLGFVQDIVVSRPYRRQQIATRLLKAARQWAYEHQLERLQIEVQTRNFPGISFCQSRGFAFCGFNDQYFANQDIAIFFGQSLR